MTFITIGCLAFLFFYVFDINKVIFIHRILNLCFALGVALLAIATIGVIFFDSITIEVSSPFRFLFGGLSFASLVLMIYSLFFALPFDKTYLKMERHNTVVDTGMYSLCRHPGVIWFFFFYCFLWLATGKMIILWAGAIWTIMDIIHVYVQDRWLFPKTLWGYQDYKKKVPFLIPEVFSIIHLLLPEFRRSNGVRPETKK